MSLKVFIVQPVSAQLFNKYTTFGGLLLVSCRQKDCISVNFL